MEHVSHPVELVSPGSRSSPDLLGSFLVHRIRLAHLSGSLGLLIHLAGSRSLLCSPVHFVHVVYIRVFTVGIVHTWFLISSFSSSDLPGSLGFPSLSLLSLLFFTFVWLVLFCSGKDKA